MSEAAFPLQPLSELVTAIKDGTHGTHRRVQSGVPLLSAKNITAGGHVEYDDNDDLISEAEYRDLCRSFQLEPNDLLLTIVGSLGRRAIYSGQRVTFQRSVAYVRPQQRKVLSRFLFHWMGHPAFSRELARRSNATAQAGLYLGELAKVSVPVPDETDQRAISQVLDNLDTAIHTTEAIIAKLKAVKQGLLHDLLTRGIGANGELRPPQAEAPHIYKQSAIGWIPKEWEAVRVGDDAEIEHGFAFPGHQFTDQQIGPTLLVPGNFHRGGGLYFTSENSKYFGGKFARQYVLSNGDVLVVMTDLSPMTLILGRTVVLNEPFEVLHNQRIGKFRFKSRELWDPAFFAEALSQDAVRNKVIAEATGTTVRHTSPDRIKGCYIARPKLEEQQFSLEQLVCLESRRNSEGLHLTKLKSTKTGLMDDLLTGRVRVAPLLARTGQIETEGSV